MSDMFDLDYNTRTFKPTVEWMVKRYNEANEKLFGGVLGECDLGIFTTGRGSRGGVNGWFKFMNTNLHINPATYKLYSGDIPLTHSNLIEVAKPRIELNGNKHGSEWAFMVTLVHEMCHYYVYRNGYYAKRPHGKEFKQIAKAVTALSGGQIEVTTHTTSERSKQMEMDNARPKKRRVVRKKYCLKFGF